MQHLGFQKVAILHKWHQVFDQGATHGQPFVNSDALVLFVAESDHKVSEEVHYLHASVVVVVNCAVRFIDRQRADP